MNRVGADDTVIELVINILHVYAHRPQPLTSTIVRQGTGGSPKFTRGDENVIRFIAA